MFLETYFKVYAHKGHFIEMHKHDFLELVYYSEGIGRTKIDRKVYNISSGDFTITPPGVFHNQDNVTDMRSYCVLLSNSNLEQFIGAWHDSEGTLKRLLLHLDGEIHDHRNAYELICFGILHEIVGFVERAVQEADSRRPAKRDLVRVALDMVLEKEGRITVSELARQLKISSDYLRHLFQKSSAKSPQRFIMDVRLDKALRLIPDQSMTLTEISELCGFSDLYYFSRTFKRKFQMSPSRYREQYSK